MWKLLPKFPLFGKKKLLLAFEYGVVLAEVAQKQGIEMTPELIKKAEIMIENEFRNESLSRLSGTMIINILSVFELDTNK